MLGYGWCSGMGVAGWLLMVAVWGGFLAVVVWAVTRLFPRSRPASDDGGESAASMLDRCLASGEIDEDTYRHLRGELTGAS